MAPSSELPELVTGGLKAARFSEDTIVDGTDLVGAEDQSAWDALRHCPRFGLGKNGYEVFGWHPPSLQRLLVDPGV